MADFVGNALRHAIGNDRANVVIKHNDELFRAWLNIVDARLDYDRRRAVATTAEWRAHFDAGMTLADAKIFAARFR
jgi:hypothetical protein